MARQALLELQWQYSPSANRAGFKYAGLPGVLIRTLDEFNMLNLKP